MKKIIHRTFSLVTALLMVLVCFVCINAETDPLLDEDYTGKTVILQSNDVHGELIGYQYMAGLRDELEKRGAEVLLADCGDFMQGSSYVGYFKGKNAVEIMNKTGYDIVVLGNHEFDYGPERLKENLAIAEFPVLCCDMVMKDNGKHVYDGTKVLTTKGLDDKEGTDDDLKLGFIGVTTPDTQTKAIPTNFKDRTFLTDKTDPKLYDDICSQINDLTKDGKTDMLIALTHLGVTGDTDYSAYDFLKNVQGRIDGEINMVLDAHSHTVMEQGSKGEPIMSTGTKFANIGVLVIDEKDKKIEKNFLYPLKENVSEDPSKPDYQFKKDLYSNAAVSTVVQESIEEVDEELSEVFARSDVFLNGFRSAVDAKEQQSAFTNGNRDGETNLGDLIADALVWYVNKEVPDLGVELDHVVAIENGGGIRASINPGDITMKDINTVLPFDNTIYAITVTGNELLEALEASIQFAPEQSGSFPQVSGINMEVNTSIAYDKGAQYPDSTYFGPKSIKRVRIKDINGKSFDKKAKYVVITNNFCGIGGDTYYAFARATSKFDTGAFLDVAVIEYIENQENGLKGVIGSKYKNPAGRIKFVTKFSKLNNTITVKAKKVTAKKKKKTVIKRTKAFTVKNAKGKVTYKKTSGNNKIKIAKNGKITVKKGLKKKTYKVKVLVTAAGNDNYKKATKQVTLKVRVK